MFHNCLARRVVTLLSLMLPSLTLAQTCENPVIIMDAPTSATTCGQVNALSFIGPDWFSPQPDVVMSFTMYPGLSGHFTVTSDFDAAYALLTTCADAAPPADAGLMTSQASTSIPLDSLIPATQYFLVITASPGSPPDACGSFHLVPNIGYPKYIFANGFDLP